MKTKAFTIFLFFIIQSAYSQSISFELFKANRDKDGFFSYSFFESEEITKSEEVIASCIPTRFSLRKIYKIDSIDLRLVNQHSGFQKDSINLIIFPKTDDYYSIEKKSEPVTINYLANPKWILSDIENPRKSTSWKLSEAEYLKKDTIGHYEYVQFNEGNKELSKTFYYTQNKSVPIQTIKYYEVDSLSTYAIPGKATYRTITKSIKTTDPSVKRVIVLKNREVKSYIKVIKIKLKKENLYHGRINNTINNDFIVSLTRYQQVYKLPIGQFDKKTMEKLNID